MIDFIPLQLFPVSWARFSSHCRGFDASNRKLKIIYVLYNFGQSKRRLQKETLALN